MASNMTTGQATLSTAASLALAANPQRSFAEMKNADAAISVYLGSTSAVTSSTGHLLKAGEAFSLGDNYTGAIYALSASGTPVITYVEWSR